MAHKCHCFRRTCYDQKSSQNPQRASRGGQREIFVSKSRKLPERPDKLSSNVTTERAFSSLGSFSPSSFRFARNRSTERVWFIAISTLGVSTGIRAHRRSTPPSSFHYSPLFSFSLCVASSTRVWWPVQNSPSIIQDPREHNLSSTTCHLYNRWKTKKKKKDTMIVTSTAILSFCVFTLE